MRWIWLPVTIGLLGCSPIWESKAQSEKIKTLEERVMELEKAARQVRVQDADRQSRLKECIVKADADYWDYLRRNGTTNRNGSIQVPIYIGEQARKNKDAQIHECQLLYGR